MECKKIFNRALSLLLAVCLAFGVLVIPPTSRGDGFNHVHAVTGSKSSHSCNIAQSGSTLTQDMMNAFIANGTIDVGDYNFSYGPLFVYATEDISWSGELSVPEGVFIGVCTGGYSYEMGTVKKAGESGGVYVLDCSVVNTEHTEHRQIDTHTETGRTINIERVEILNAEPIVTCFNESECIYRSCRVKRKRIA